MKEYCSSGPFCKCDDIKSIHTEIGEWGQWDVCDNCNMQIEDSFECFDHYDGEDHLFEY